MPRQIDHTSKNLHKRGMKASMIFALALAALSSAQAEKTRVYFGSGTTQAQEGIFTCMLDPETGRLSKPLLAAEAVRPGFVAIDPSGTHLYSIGKPGGYTGPRGGSVCAFRIDPATGTLDFLKMQSSQGTGPCYLEIDPTGRNILVAHYRGGNCFALPLAKDGLPRPVSSFHQHTGSSVNPKRQSAPHPHAIVLDAAGRFAFVPDLGLDQIKIYRFDPATGKLVPNQPSFVAVPPGSGPRHFLFHPNGKFAYASLEMASEAIAFRYDAAPGTLEPFQTLSTLPDGFSAMNTTAGIGIAPDGRFLYISNRGHNSIAVFAIDPATGKLSRIENASTGTLMPHAMGMDPSGRVLIATDKNSGETGVFKIDRKTGRLAHTDTLNVPKAGNIAFLR